MRLRRMLVVAVSSGLGALAVPATASAANVTNAVFGFCNPSCLETTTTGTAGAGINYHFEFTVPSGFDGGAPPNGDGSHSFTIDGSGGKAPGTVFPAAATAYQIGHGIAGYSVHPFRSGAIVLSNSGQTLTVTPFNGSLNVNPGETMELDIFGGATNGCTAGTGKFFTINTSLDGGANTNNFTLTAGDPAQIAATSGANQSATVDTSFGSPLQAQVTDTCGNGVPGKNVTFATPESGAGGNFGSGSSTTDSSGFATSPTLTANTVAGAWQATASVAGGSNPSTTFDFTNTPGAPDNVHMALAPDMITADGFSTTTATLSAEDQYDNPIPGISTSQIDFTPQDPGQTVGTVTDVGGGDYSAAITASSTPGDSVITGTFDDGITSMFDTATLHQTADLVAPIASIDSRPGRRTSDRTPTFEFSSDDGNAEFDCKLDGDRYKSCDSPHTTAKLDLGRHTLKVRAEDPAGNVGPADSATFKVIKRN